MSNNYAEIANISLALAQQAFPSITLWNRLEGRPGAADFSRALRAEVRDALWMLTKQWQLGEFRGDDAGSPVMAKIHMTTSPLHKYQPGAHAVRPFPDDLPLEAAVEQRTIPFRQGEQEIALDLRLQMGRQWLKLVEGVAPLRQAYIGRYGIDLPDPSNEADATVCAHAEVRAQFSAVAGRAMDGAKLYFYLKSNAAHHAYDGIPGVLPHQQGDIDAAAARFIAWFEALYTQPEQSEDAWKPACLEYQFACAAPSGAGEAVYTADEYAQGRLDWYSLDIDMARETLGAPGGVVPAAPPPLIQSFIPSAITFDGMPNTRWWAFEDGRTNFGDIKPDTRELAKLLLIEFGLVYANDWFLFPVTLRCGSIAQVRGLAVTNVFGERFWIEPAGKGADENWQRWSMYTTSVKGHSDVPAELSLLLLPTAPSVQEGAAREGVMLVRDEVANMVWGIEETVPMPDGSSTRGSEAAAELKGHLQRLVDASIAIGGPQRAAVPYAAPIRYRVMNAVPENWIPFIPVHVPGDNREVQLQRAAMPRILAGDPNAPERVRPRTSLLREGLDRIPPESYFVHEEEIPRAGTRLSQAFQRTRWYGGRVVVWLGARKGTGRGEAASGLAFDQIVHVDQSKSE